MNNTETPDLGRMKALQERFRRARFKRVEALIRHVLASKDTCSILDVGGRGDYWKLLPVDLAGKVSITVMNYSDELEIYDLQSHQYFAVKNVVGNACSMPEFENGSFDVIHSNSVIEHVRSYQNMMQFAEETKRVGKYYYIQTPNYFFPIDPHYSFPFIHWLPDNLKIRALSTFRVGTAITGGFTDALAEVDNCRMLGSWLFRRLYADGKHYKERFLGIFTKSFIVVGSEYGECPILE